MAERDPASRPASVDPAELAYYDHIEAPKVTAYIHMDNKSPTPGALSHDAVDEQVGKNIAMQVAAMQPVAVDKDGVPEDIKEKELERWIKYGPNKKDKIFIEFHKPEYDRGLKLLVHRKTRKSDLIWLKLPSLRRERRISGQDESNYFAETDLTYRDTVQLVGEDVSNYNYKLLDRKSSYAWCIKATPTEEITPVYGQRIFFVDDDLIIRKIEYYDHSNDLIKVQKNKNVIVQDNGKWRIDLLEIVNHRHDRKTITEVLDRKSGNFSQPPSFSKRDLRR